ncbi:hypothetical protein PVAND_004788 [Polypedilum vanderplanki]|uniref:Uncharacterized protein n=1 Tax=Polypedilum vanderplanki TaxID=319348 RepID=A0A9J6BZ58_POLVA|nr:hypothetical protein PVAND_004788 [Polypedilum vanderplanki]
MEISAVSFSRQISLQAKSHRETTKDDQEDFQLFINDEEVKDFSLFVEQMLSSNDVNFPVIFDFLKMNKLVPDLNEIYNNIGYTIVTNMNDKNARWKLIRNLSYLKMNACDLNLELLNFLRSLAFGGNKIKHGDLHSNINVMKIILPFLTNFFDDEKYWNKIRYFCFDTIEVKEAINFLVLNYGKEKNYKYIQPSPKNAFSLKHLARNKVRDIIWNNNYKSNNHKCNVRYYNHCKANLPVVLFKYINFLD